MTLFNYCYAFWFWCWLLLLYFIRFIWLICFGILLWVIFPQLWLILFIFYDLFVHDILSCVIALTYLSSFLLFLITDWWNITALSKLCLFDLRQFVFLELVFINNTIICCHFFRVLLNFNYLYLLYLLLLFKFITNFLLKI